MKSLTDSILIVDDESPVSNLLSNYLGKAGYFCQVANNAEQAKQILTETSFDLLLTDREMPGESGLELIQYTKERYPHTAAVMVTGFDDPELAKEVLAVGVYGYIIKPFTKNLILITVENALRRHRLELQVQLHTKLLEREVKIRTQLLDEQLSLLQTLIDAIPAPIYYKDANHVYLGCNRAFEESHNRSRDFIIGKTAEDIYPPGLAEAIQRKDQELLQQGSTQIFEKDVFYPDGSLHTEITHKATFTDSKGVISGLVGVRLDITELKMTEQSLRASEEKLRSVMDNLHIGVALISPHMELLQLNRQMLQWFPGALTKTGLCCYQIFVSPHQQDPCVDCPAKMVFDTGTPHEALMKMQTSAGERILRVTASPIHDGTGTITAAIELIEDVTDKLAVERELRQAQKLESIGQLAAGIAHEINTPVQYVGDNIRFLGDAFRDLVAVNEKYAALLHAVQAAEPVTSCIQEVEQAIDKADLPFLFEEIPKTIEQSSDGINHVGAIVRAMREFSHPGSEEKTNVDINKALESTITVSRNEWKYVADLETDLAQDLPFVSCLPGEMNQVFLNIIVNAAHAIGDRAEGGSKDKGLIKLSTRLLNGWVEIRISDTGGGIPEAVQHRIFDPFFTTKQIGKGTGQGLAIARSVVVDKHQGTLRFDTEAGKGSTFIIGLPLH